jgi:hypothetical protein
MNINDVINLYIKERQYEQFVFGDYAKLQSLNLASFLVLLDHYLQKAKKAYCGKWTKKQPPWLIACRENLQDGETAPVTAYEELIKIFALAGSALETYTEIDSKKWRDSVTQDMKKWKEEECQLEEGELDE